MGVFDKQLSCCCRYWELGFLQIKKIRNRLFQIVLLVIERKTCIFASRENGSNFSFELNYSD